MEIKTPDEVFIGGSQHWYDNRYHRMSGCGPTTAANLLWYLAQSHEWKELYEADEPGADSYISIHTGMFSCVTPGLMGVNSSAMFVNGIRKYAEAHRLNLRSYVLDIPVFFKKRPAEYAVKGFIMKAMRADCPVAFLTLSNGNQKQLENWHWVTIIEFDDQSMNVCISDQGRILEVNLSAWMKTSVLGGTLIYLAPQ